MSTEQSDYRELLATVLPVDRLDESLQQLIREALQKDDPRGLWRTAILALEALCGDGLYTRGAEDQESAGAVYFSRESLQTITIEPPDSTPHRYEFPFRPSFPAGIPGDNQAFESLITGIVTRTSDDDLQSALAEVGDYMSAQFSTQEIRFYLYEDGGLRSLDGTAPPRIAEQFREHFEQGGDPIYVPDIRDEPALARQLRGSARSIASLPLRAGGKTLGAVHLLLTSADSLSEQDRGLLSLLALVAAGRVSNARALEELIYIDVLTGVFTRRFFEEQILRELDRANRDEIPLSLVMVDLDNFSEINNTHGHPVGDRVLASVGRLLNDHVRKIDLVTRYGGEEFALLLPGAAKDQAEQICERIRVLVSELAVPLDGKKKISLTTSIGIAVYPDQTGTKGEPEALRKDLLEKADQALYLAKKSGKNKVVIWRSS